MKSQVNRHLSSLSEEISSARAELERLRDRLGSAQAALDECRLRMLIAETPLADRDLQRAAEAHIRIQGEVLHAEQVLASLFEDEQRLNRRMQAAGA
jgi:chromosome segregation ATPase